MDKQLRIMAGAIVMESKLSKVAKLQMLNFIRKEATIPQIKVLLMDGEIVTLDEQAEEIVNARFKQSNLNEDVIAIGGLLTVSLIVAAVTAQAYKIIRAVVSKAHRTCLKYSGNEKQKCVDMVKKKGLEGMISTLTSGKSKCSKSKDPKKCQQLLNNKISKAKKKLDKIATRTI